MKNLYAKLLAIQKEVAAIKKDKENPFFKSEYFDINSLLDELKPLLNKNGLVVLQPLHNAGIETIVVDSESGESLNFYSDITQNTDPQKMGAAITYFRRYALQSLFLLQSTDDDANSAVNVPQASKHVAVSTDTKEEWHTCHCGVGKFKDPYKQCYNCSHPKA